MSDVRRTAALVRCLASPGPLLDGAIVAALFAADVTVQAMATAGLDVASAELGAGAVVLAAVNAVVLWWRRRRPLTVVAGVLALYAIAAAVTEPGLFSQLCGASAVLALYAMSSWSDHRRWALAIPAVLGLLVGSGSLDDGKGVAESAAAAMAIGALPWALGYAARTRRLYLVEVERRLADAERERVATARRAVLDERAHIARELHDVVAHHVSLIGVQAGAARTALGGSPEATRAALEAIEASSRAAVGEMRHVLDALRDEERSALVAPQPRLADLDQLVEGFRGAGINVIMRRRGSAAGLPPLVELCCYRIVEEALTNVARHSAASVVMIDIDRHDHGIHLAVADPGPPRHAHGRGGRGVVGMTERVALFGGTISVGPGPDGGFAVVAELPRQIAVHQ